MPTSHDIVVLESAPVGVGVCPLPDSDGVHSMSTLRCPVSPVVASSGGCDGVVMALVRSVPRPPAAVPAATGMGETSVAVPGTGEVGLEDAAAAVL